MAKGSQLTQLKTALSSAGLSRQSQPGSSKSKAKDGGPGPSNKRKRGPDDEKKLDRIRKAMNPFEEKVTRLKHDVGGRKLKGASGKPSEAKQAGLEERKRNLLPALAGRNRTGTFVDRRFGESNPTLTPEEKMLERFTKEKQRSSARAGKADLFNLGDDDDDGGLTHYGKSLAFDDFDGEGLGVGLEDDEDDRGQIDRDTVQRSHFGGFDDDGPADDEPERKKTKSEVMAEVMAKSKDHKFMRQMEREKDDATRQEIDSEFATLRDLLMGVPLEGEPDPEDPSLAASSANRVPLGTRVGAPLLAPTDTLTAEAAAQPVDYDTFVKSLAFEKRAKPTDRTKTEEEIAAEEKDRLEEAERKRLKRMNGQESDDEDEGAGKGGKKGKGKAKVGRKPGADDLEDDFEMDEDEGEGAYGLGEGLGGMGSAVVNGDEDEEMVSGEEGDNAEESDGDDSEVDEDEDDYSDISGSDVEPQAASDEDAVEADVPAAPKPAPRKTKSSSKATSAPATTLPFTFPCPTTHADFLDLLEAHSVTAPSDVALVVSRIRTLHHPKLAPGNKERMQIFLTILLDHIFSVLAPPADASSWETLSLLLPHITALTASYTLLAAQHTVSKLVLMQKNLARGLSKGATLPGSKTWPGAAELGMLRVIGMTWSTSDFSHPVVAPSMLLMGQYLSQARVREGKDVASGLFLSSLVLQYETLSKRFMPESTNFLALAILVLAPHTFTVSTLPGTFTFSDFDSPRCASLRIRPSKAQTLAPAPAANLSKLLAAPEGEDLDEQVKVDLLATALRLLLKYAKMWSSFEGYVEIFKPFATLLAGLKTSKFSPELQGVHRATLQHLSNSVRINLVSRVPLKLQSHKPIPIPSFAPKFEGASYDPGRRYDPDAERNAASKLRNEYKQERKGAIRELRKDAKFLAGERERARNEKDAAYESRMRSVHGAITVERAEEKAIEREKARDKRRAGGKK